MKFFKRGPLAVALLSLIAIGVVYASARYVTNIGILQLDQNEVRDSNGTARLTVGATNAIVGNLTVSGTTSFTGASTHAGATTFGVVSVGTMTVSNAQGLVFSPNFITSGTTIAASTGTLAFDSSWVLYVATGTANAYQWVKVGGQ